MPRSSLRSRVLTSLMLFSLGAFTIFLVLTVQNKFSSDRAFAQSLIRLHVVAHSNSPTDQALKLVVRDAVLRETREILAETQDKQQAYALLREHEQKLQARAQEVVFAQGFDYPVQVRMGHFDFPWRDYGNLVLPEGSYDAVRVEIGGATGDNWWCVLFPPLCLADFEGAQENLVKVEEKPSGPRLVFRSKIWDHVAQTRYAQAFKKWWQASAADLTVLSHLD
ncbi:MAG: stage II sporulation protein R [Firmicutes bacterium]|nr:stage II sporulation protein R [Bacillota bacterium]